ncbi:MAG: EFR1 family ferrodoxin [Muribaculaceae bacterium]|nr:EFR1 family ferrodoxin [Muribaculaceae bacterium]
MIYYYSATGNTAAAARYLANTLGQSAVDILKDSPESPLPGDDEPIGIMFPIYCWGIPPVVTEFLHHRLLHQVSGSRYLWGVCTCGDEAGTAMRELNQAVKAARGREADALWSVIMPNTYVMLPGFDTDSAEVEKAKLAAAPRRLDAIAAKINERARGLYDVKEGSFPRLRSAIFPAFRRWGVNTAWWHVSDACIGCGRCASVCPADNLTMADNRPVWGRRCFSCCACYHCCPTHAISYASFTKGKSQYGGPSPL